MGAVMGGREVLLVVLAGAACAGETLGPASGALEVTASVVGDGSDPDGFLVVVSRTIQRSMVPGESVLLNAVAPGDYEVALEGIGPNCTPLGPALLPATIVVGDTAHVAFEVTCDPAVGALRVTVKTRGSDLDPSGYDVLLEGSRAAIVQPDDAMLLTVSAGDRTVTLGDLNPNCEIVEPASRSLAVPVGGLATADFEIRCTATTRAGRGHEIAYTSTDSETEQSRIYVVNDDGSHAERLFPEITHSHHSPAWAPDSTRIAFYARLTDSVVPVDSVVVALTIADVEDGQRSEFTTQDFRSRAIAWSPDGSRLALGRRQLVDECPTIIVFHLDDSGEQPLDVGCYPDATFESLAWSPDGRQIAFVAVVVTAEPPTPPDFPEEPENAKLNTRTLTAVEPVTEIGTLGLADLAIPGRSTSPAGCTFQDAHSVSWSPDGSRLAVAADGIFVVDLASTTCTRLTDETSDVFPSWSPDGTRIAFSSRRDGNSDIYVMQADGSSQTRITRSPLGAFAPSWRP